jgi:GTP cyclohydrolase FolE2
MRTRPGDDIADVQNQPDGRGIALDYVGVTGLHYPLSLRSPEGGAQTVTARVDLLVGLHGAQRGAHLSALVEALEGARDQVVGLPELVALVRTMRAQQDVRGLPADAGALRIRFKYFAKKYAPASGAASLLAYDGGFEVELAGAGGGEKSTFVNVPITTVCPCSLEISDVGAHNQRADVQLQLWQALDDRRIVWLDELIRLVEGCGSAELFSVLKRRDEKVVTERMFETPRFVEDVVRGVVVAVRERIGGVRYHVRCESQESIHAHNAVAEVSGRSA